MGNKKKLALKISLGALFVIIASVTAIYFIVGPFDGGKELPKPETAADSARFQKEEDSLFVEAFIDKAAAEDTVEVIHVSSPSGEDIPYKIDKEAGKPYRTVYRGRRVNIAITGLDSRLGTRSNHADANHVVSILLDSGKVEIISVPRDTHADAGYDEESHPQNKITIVRAARGRNKYHSELAKIARVDKIHHWVEVGFSQVIGILELLGYDDSGSALQMLRSRKALGGDDYQRVYNQAQFIRQMIYRYFDKFTGLSGEIVMRGGFAIVETDMGAGEAKEIIEALEEKNFPEDIKDISIKIRPPVRLRYKEYDFTNDSVVTALKAKIENYNTKKSKKSSGKKRPGVEKILTEAIEKSAADSARSPIRVIRRLSTFFGQRAWFQVNDKRERAKLRDQMAILLIDAYNKKEEYEKAEKIRKIVLNEKELFNSNIFEEKQE